MWSSSSASPYERATSTALMAATGLVILGHLAPEGTTEGASPLVELERFLPWLFILWLGVRAAVASADQRDARVRWPEAAIGVAMIYSRDQPGVPLYLLLLDGGVRMLARPIAATWSREAGVRQVEIQPWRFLVAGFASLILIGTLLLMLPAARAVEGQPDLIEALFTATSATCVTGLVVVDTGSHWSAFGQGVILALIQLGGLGIMSISAASAFLLGSKLGIRGQRVMFELLDSGDIDELRHLIFAIVTGTAFIEAVGWAVLTVRFHASGKELLDAVWFGLFHSVSAFCNAGFGLYANSLENFRDDATMMLCVSLLILLGGIGFTVLAELTSRRRRSVHRFSFHTRLVLVTSGALLAAGCLLFWFSEAGHSMQGYSLKERVLSVWFTAVTPRTAGFNVIPMDRLSEAGVLITMVLMFIGGSPGSAAGGIKTTTFAITVLALWRVVTGGSGAVFGRRPPESAVQKAFVIAGFSLGLVLLATCLLCFLEEARLELLLFEAVSAFGTVGLSLGVTPQLSPPGRLLIVLLMFIGRVGPLALALALGWSRRRGVEHPEGRVLIG